MVTRRKPAPVSTPTRIWRWIDENLLTGPAPLVDRDASLGRLVQKARFFRMTEDKIVDLVARRMYDTAMAAGAYDADVGLWGHRLFRRDAAAFIASMR